MFSWSYRLRGPAKVWVASSAGVLVGVLIAFVLPVFLRHPREGVDPAAVAILLRCLGGAFIFMGGVPLALMFVSLWAGWKSPRNAHVWRWWANFLGGLIGACSAAVPMALLFPVVGVLWLFRPNTLFPEEGESATKNLLIALLFSVVGCAILPAIFFVGRWRYRERPRFVRPETGGVAGR